MNDRGFRGDVEAIKDDIAVLKSDLAAAMRDLIEASKAGTEDARHRLQEMVAARLDGLNEAAESLSERSKQVLGHVQRRVEEKPIQTLAIALGVGALLGMIFLGARRK
jgi:ElaB/YqjD/DUF883 family membrane-anchored ribosome-binding protein